MPDELERQLPPDPKRSIIGQVTYHLNHLASMLYCIDEHHDEHNVRLACTDSFLLDFRALYYFLLENRQGDDAHRLDFLDQKAWQPKKRHSEAAGRMATLADFISKHRAHLSRSRFVPEYQSLQDVLHVRRLTVEYLGQVMLDYLEFLDDFIDKLLDTRESGKRAWIGAADSARYMTEVALGLRASAWIHR